MIYRVRQKVTVFWYFEFPLLFSALHLQFTVASFLIGCVILHLPMSTASVCMSVNCNFVTVVD